MRRIAVIAAVIWYLSVSLAAAGEAQSTKPAEKDKCPVCGMFVAKYPDWVAEVVLKDNTRRYFDGPKDLFKFIIHLERYVPGKDRKDIDAVFVNDYYAVRSISGLQAFYVLGSDVFGPMGKELIPFEKETAAREFLKDHGARKVLRFNEITPAVLKELD